MEIKNIDKKAIESFKHAKVVYMITYGENGEKHSRPMTNFNDTLEGEIWFPTYRDTLKVADIKENPETMILFPSSDKDTFYELKGKASLADPNEVEEKWVWWYLYWHPEIKDFYWFDHTKPHPERVIIDIKAENIKTINRDEIKEIRGTYKTVVPRD